MADAWSQQVLNFDSFSFAEAVWQKQSRNPIEKSFQ
jgi:hypothetical protein